MRTNNISPIYGLPVLAVENVSVSRNAIQNNNQILNYPKGYMNNNYFVGFTGSLKKPLTDEDFQKAKEYYNSLRKEDSKRCFSLTELDLDKLNGIQKGISVFDGLSMKDIAFIFGGNYRPTLLLNRGCSNNCAHCAYMATPITNKTYDKMSFEDFKSIADGVSELESRLDNKTIVCSGFGTFFDSDCMEIELTDKDGRIYDYMDCADILREKGNMPVLFDTSGWNPDSEKMQKRAEKFVDYMLQPENKTKIRHVYISVNPYHSLYTKSVEAQSKFQFADAKKMKNMYIKRMANAMHTFTPLLDANIEIGIITRAASKKDIDSKCNDDALQNIRCAIHKELKKMYKDDLSNHSGYVKTKEDMKKYLDIWMNLLKGADYDDDITPWGRAEALFKAPVSDLESRRRIAMRYLDGSTDYLRRNINPNGEVILVFDDVSARTNLGFNFEHKNNRVKPFANEIKDYVFEFDEE